MNRRRDSKSGLFMMEMLAVVFFFILCASICIMVFVRANNMSQLGQDVNKGISAAQSLAEYVKAYGEDGFAEYFGGERKEDGHYSFYWDRDWKQTSNPEMAVYEAVVALSTEDQMLKCTLNIEKNGKSLFSMDTLKYEKP